MGTKDELLKEISQAQKGLEKSYMMAVTAVPLAADVPAIIELKVLAKKCTEVMQAVSKLRI